MSALISNTIPDATLPEFADWQAFQREFTLHIRNPKKHPKPRGLNRQRMQIYSDTLYTQIADTVSACYPILASIVGARKWQRLIRGFFADYRCHTPYLRQVPEEFLNYLQNESFGSAVYPDYMIELAHYEWVELALSTSNRDEFLGEYSPDGDLLAEIPIANPVMSNLAYRYPVHRIGPHFKPKLQPQEMTYLLVYRDTTDEIRFSLQNSIVSRLLDLIIPAKMSGRQALMQLAAELNYSDPGELIEFGTDFIENLRTLGCLMGTRPLIPTCV